MTRTSLRFAPVGLAAGAVLMLTGCIGSIDTSGAERVDGARTTINAEELAVTAEGIVAEQGFTVDIDCGTEDVPFVVGTSLECAGFDEASETSGTYTVTITSIDGDVYGLDVVGSEAQPTPPAGAAFETASAFADLTAQAIADALGETPLVDCGTDDIEIFAGQEVRCAYESSTTSGFVIATVTEFDGSTYAIEVVEE